MEEFWAGLIIHIIEQVSRTLSDTSHWCDTISLILIFEAQFNIILLTCWQILPFTLFWNHLSGTWSQICVVQKWGRWSKCCCSCHSPMGRFLVFVCGCLSKNDRSCHISVAPGEVLETGREAGEQHVFKAFFGQNWKRFSLVQPFLPTPFGSRCLFLFCVIFKWPLSLE